MEEPKDKAAVERNVALTGPEAERLKLRKFLVDFGFQIHVLEDIIAERLRKSGYPDAKQDTRLREVRATKGLTTLAQSNPATRTMEIDVDILEKRIQDYRNIAKVHTDAGGTGGMHFVRSMIHNDLIKSFAHEYTHVRAGLSERSTAKLGDDFQAQNGLEQYTVTSDDTLESPIVITTRNTSLNEAVTEKIARELYEEYSRRIGQTGLARRSQDVQERWREIRPIEDREGYGNIVDSLNFLIGHIAGELEISPEAVWQGIQHAYFNHLPEAEELLREISSFLDAEMPILAEASYDSEEWNPLSVMERIFNWEMREGKEFSSLYKSLQ